MTKATERDNLIPDRNDGDNGRNDGRSLGESNSAVQSKLMLTVDKLSIVTSQECDASQ